jgi:hypothetical protein
MMLTTKMPDGVRTERLFDDCEDVIAAYHEAIESGAVFAEIRGTADERWVTYRRNGATDEGSVR